MPGSILVTPFSSPATARRRRGRPPKHVSSAQSSKYTFPYQQSPSSSESGTEGPETPSARPARASVSRRSRLAQELRFETEQQSADAGPSHTLPAVEVVNAVPETSTSQATQDYLLSHFAGDGSRDTPIPLDSSSFAAFLPQSPPAHAHHTLDSSLSGPAVHITDDAGNILTETPNVMSRFKRGPPGSCDICSRTQTSVWRKLTYEGEELRVCNGEYWIVISPCADQSMSNANQRVVFITPSFIFHARPSFGVMGGPLRSARRAPGTGRASSGAGSSASRQSTATTRWAWMAIIGSMIPPPRERLGP